MEQKPCNPIVQNDKVKIALGCAQSPISIGKFTGSFKNGETNIYYSVDLGLHSKKIYNAETNNYEDLQNLHWSFHNSLWAKNPVGFFATHLRYVFYKTSMFHF